MVYGSTTFLGFIRGWTYLFEQTSNAEYFIAFRHRHEHITFTWSFKCCGSRSDASVSLIFTGSSCRLIVAGFEGEAVSDPVMSAAIGVMPKAKLHQAMQSAENPRCTLAKRDGWRWARMLPSAGYCRGGWPRGVAALMSRRSLTGFGVRRFSP